MPSSPHLSLVVTLTQDIDTLVLSVKPIYDWPCSYNQRKLLGRELEVYSLRNHSYLHEYLELKVYGESRKCLGLRSKNGEYLVRSEN